MTDKIEQELEKELGFRILKDCPDADTTDYYLVQDGETDPDREATQFEVTLWQSLLASRREVEEHDKHGILLRQDVRLLKQQRENVAKLLEDAITEAATLERENAELKEKLETMKGQRDLYKRCLDELRIAIDLRANSIANKEDSHA